MIVNFVKRCVCLHVHSARRLGPGVPPLPLCVRGEIKIFARKHVLNAYYDSVTVSFVEQSTPATIPRALLPTSLYVYVGYKAYIM